MQRGRGDRTPNSRRLARRPQQHPLIWEGLPPSQHPPAGGKAGCRFLQQEKLQQLPHPGFLTPAPWLPSPPPRNARIPPPIRPGDLASSPLPQPQPRTGPEARRSSGSAPDPPSALLRPWGGGAGHACPRRWPIPSPPRLPPPGHAYANRPGPASRAAAAALGTQRCQRLGVRASG